MAKSKKGRLARLPAAPCHCGRFQIGMGYDFTMEGFVFEHWRHACGRYGLVERPPAATPPAKGEP